MILWCSDATALVLAFGSVNMVPFDKTLSKVWVIGRAVVEVGSLASPQAGEQVPVVSHMPASRKLREYMCSANAKGYISGPLHLHDSYEC